MNKLLVGAIGLVAFMVILVPGIVIALIGGLKNGGEISTAKLESVMINVYLHDQDKIVAMPLEEYVKGVVAAEMPAEFDIEALKAQAVAARTYAVKNMRSFGGEGFKEKADADVSTDFAKSQAWVSSKVLEERWGGKFAQYWDKISKAVDGTHGQIAVYQDQPISAVFHSTSGGKTASAKEIWGTDFPYLQSVDCKWDKDSPRYQEKKEFAMDSLGKLLGDDTQVVAALQNGNTDAAKVLSYTESGRVKEIKIGSKTFSGSELRSLLGLRSDNFKASVENDKIIFETIGYGHGVGLCQYGANGMAKEGSKYQEILKHYYTGIELKNIYGS